MGRSKDIASGAKFVDVTGDTMTGNLTLGSTSTSQPTLQMLSSTSGANTIHFGDAASGADSYKGYINYAHNTDQIQFAVNGAVRQIIDSSGNVTTPNNPWFDVRGSNSNWTSAAAGENILNIFSTSLYQNTGGGFNSSNSTYTAPVAGRYCFLLNSYTKGGSTGASSSYVYPRLYKNGSAVYPRSNILHYNANENNDTGMENTILVDLAANDTIQAGFYSNNTANQYYGAVWHLQMFFVG